MIGQAWVIRGKKKESSKSRSSAVSIGAKTFFFLAKCLYIGGKFHPMTNNIVNDLKSIHKKIEMERTISLELATAYNKTRKVVNSSQTRDHLKSSVNMIYNFEIFFQRKYNKHLDKDLRAELFRCSDRLRELFMEKHSEIH